MARTTSDPLVQRLAKVELFDGLSAKQLAAIAGAMRERSFASGQAIIEEGATDGRFYLIDSGTAEVSVKGTVVEALGEGDYFGEIALIDNGPRTASVTATSDVRALTLAHFNFRAVLRDNPDLVHKLLVQVCRFLRNTEAELYT
jgi:CRP/FNR family transcriptional regulator, cyclic AMP receptor protein